MNFPSRAGRAAAGGCIRALAAAVAAWALSFAAPAAAQEMPERFREATAWIEQNSAYQNIRPVRSWMELTPEEMTRQAFTNGMRSAMAMYYCNAQSIALLSKLEDGRYIDWSRPYSRAILVHELTHHAQCVSGRWSGISRCALEKEAYGLQAKFLREQEQTHPSPAERALAGQHAAEYEQIAAGDGCGNYNDGR